jgi:hypothetical protein
VCPGGGRVNSVLEEGGMNGGENEGIRKSEEIIFKVME